MEPRQQGGRGEHQGLGTSSLGGQGAACRPLESPAEPLSFPSPTLVKYSQFFLQPSLSLWCGSFFFSPPWMSNVAVSLSLPLPALCPVLAAHHAAAPDCPAIGSSVVPVLPAQQPGLSQPVPRGCLTSHHQYHPNPVMSHSWLWHACTGLQSLA